MFVFTMFAIKELISKCFYKDRKVTVYRLISLTVYICYYFKKAWFYAVIFKRNIKRGVYKILF